LGEQNRVNINTKTKASSHFLSSNIIFGKNVFVLQFYEKRKYLKLMQSATFGLSWFWLYWFLDYPGFGLTVHGNS
jgi:hypothetical protein